MHDADGRQAVDRFRAHEVHWRIAGLCVAPGGALPLMQAPPGQIEEEPCR
ncbi:MAG: hypothetical protein ACOX3S_13635 [Anaerolineae bacterium]|jgi:hypothetical protein